VQLGLETFSSNASVVVSPTTDRSSVLAALNNLQPGGGTATGSALTLALNAVMAVPPAANGKPAPAAIVLMSDGTPTIGSSDQTPADAVSAATAAAKRAGVEISTIAFGTQDGAIDVRGQLIPVPSDPASMAQIASESGGQTFTAKTASQLKSVYRQIGRAVGFDVHHREISAWFTGLALLLAMLAGITALIWNQRLV
jgi:Ca-activated chloride channel family protein